ncbi:MAG: hypothetical protein FRX48_07728 [Lasallia pustulata]|uniref:Uncharacterized protein n=1 Tax=Lasallia pustulata TaxID=136370 RepID=A0A5M8PIG5_9LECA|nr:MAG: hypothetical protein FRX48_07728 [Lasallia pustulata]
MPDGFAIRSEHSQSAQSAYATKSYHYHPDANDIRADVRLRSNNSLPRAQVLCENDEPTSLAGQVYSENTPRRSTPRLQHKQPVNGLRDLSVPLAHPMATIPPRRNPNGKAHYSMASEFSNLSPRSLPQMKRKENGFRMTLRRFFGRKPSRGPIHITGPAPNRRNDPATLKPSAMDPQAQRSMSLPIQGVTHQSALGSHSPLVPNKLPPKHEHLPVARVSERRTASLPGGTLTTPSGEVAPIIPEEQNLASDSQPLSGSTDIGFAITSGSNPKRRSKSADDLRDMNREHRMSPIQWRRWRRRSDEIRRWRESSVEIPAIYASISPHLAEDVEEADMQAKHTLNLEQERENGEEAGNFDFGLLASTMNSQERIGIDERVITLEVKMMDLEYAISKLQGHTPGRPSLSEQTYSVGDNFQAPALQEDGTSLDPESLALMPPPKHSHSSIRESTASTASTFLHKQPNSYYLSEPSVFTSLRPPSTAITLRPAKTVDHQPASSQIAKEPGSSRSSTAVLTLEQYMTLTSLIRREQAARMRLEDQVTKLQKQVSDLQRTPSSSWMLGPLGSMDSIAYRPQTRPRRSRPSQESQETDTDDDGFQDVYETPAERSPVEFQALRAGEEGVAF